MNRFIEGSHAAFEELRQRAHGQCAVFPDCKMPAGTTPARARVGFEIHDGNSRALLYIDKGLSLPDAPAEVAEWLTRGQREFPDFDQLVAWLRNTLSPLYANTDTRHRNAVNHPPTNAAMANSDDPERLTDMTAVQSQLNEQAPRVMLDPVALAATLGRQVRGQTIATDDLAHEVCQHLAKEKPRRPATLFAVGPTGVGKTLAAEVLADALAQPAGGTERRFLRLDMAEYQEAHRVSQLLGAPQGYVGYGDGAQLADTLSAHPGAVILFDEIEKAHPRILQALMNAMDAGRLSTPPGPSGKRNIDCRRAIFLFTSNLKADDILSALEHSTHNDASARDQLCRQHLQAAGIAPELIGRIRRFLVFKPLSPAVRGEALTLAMARLAREYGLELDHVAPQVITDLLTEQAGSWGMRPDEYRLDRLLGPLFRDYRQQRDSARMRIAASPLRCLAVEE